MSQFFTISSGGGGGGTGTVTSFSFTNANGFAGVVITPTTTPNLTVSTTVANFNTVYANAGALVGITPGIAGQVLTSNGPTAAPTYQNIALTTVYTNVTTAMSPYTVNSTDYFISVDSSAGPVTINLPDTPTTNRQFIVKDRLGQSQTNNITIKSLSGATTVDKQASYIFVDNFESLEVLYNSANYEVF